MIRAHALHEFWRSYLVCLSVCSSFCLSVLEGGEARDISLMAWSPRTGVAPPHIRYPTGVVSTHTARANVFDIRNVHYCLPQSRPLWAVFDAAQSNGVPIAQGGRGVAQVRQYVARCG